MEMAPAFNYDHLNPLPEKYCIVPESEKCTLSARLRNRAYLGYGRLAAR